MNISKQEWKIMHLLWKDPPQTITQLTKALGEKKGWNKNIIITYLKRLEEKGAVYYEKGTKAKQYFPKITKEEAEQTEIRSLLDKVFHGNAGILVNTMVKNEMLQEEEITQLYNLLHGGNNDKDNGFS